MRKLEYFNVDKSLIFFFPNCLVWKLQKQNKTKPDRSVRKVNKITETGIMLTLPALHSPDPLYNHLCFKRRFLAFEKLIPTRSMAK